MNLVGCWFGAMPVCHGAGGLAAQHVFGARGGGAVVLLGATKIGLGECERDTILLQSVFATWTCILDPVHEFSNAPC